MQCSFCSEIDTKVIDSRLVSESTQIRRRRECIKCGERFTTYEVAELLMPHVVKHGGSRQPFDEEKLRRSMRLALRKRPVSTEQFEETLQRIMRQLRATGEREVNSQVIGEMVMKELWRLDQVAYVRFASVYRSFKDIQEFHVEIERLQQDQTS